MKVTIDIPATGESQGTVVRTEDGAVLDHVRRIDITLEADQIAKARLEFVMPHVRGGKFIASVSEQHLRELAEAHGFSLMRIIDVTDLASRSREKGFGPA